MKSIQGSASKPFSPENIQSGSELIINGSVYRIRDMGTFAFIILRTSRHLVQCVLDPQKCDFNLGTLQENDSIEAFGVINSDERAANGFELCLLSISILSSPFVQMPISINKKGLNVSLEVNLQNRPFVLRNHKQRAVFKLQEGIVSGFRNHMISMGFTEIHSPKIVKFGAEGGANIFKLDYFGEKAYLAQSPQFYKQTMVGVFDRVFEIAPVYRAEKHNTSRHLNEYIGLDFEMAYIKDMYDVMAMETSMLREVMDELKTNYSAELNLLNVDLPQIDVIPAFTFIEGKELLKSLGHKIKNYYDFEPDEEIAISEYVKKEYNSEFVFISHFPSSKRPFYVMDDKDDPDYALSFDLFFRGLEITTGGQRIHDYAEQVQKMKEKGLDPNDFESYLMIHKYGMPPHGGLGIGLERLLMRLLNQQNVREASLFPRDMTRLDP
ncbi:MAG TPA: aspartate--tRNA(Asn) ligase [Ruminiclostridium sp.]